METLKRQTEEDPGAESRRRRAAGMRAAIEREARIQAALERLPELAEIKERQGKPGTDARRLSPRRARASRACQRGAWRNGKIHRL